MKEFLKENWVWFVAPFIVAGLAIGALMLLGGDDGSPFIYQIF